MNKLSRKDIAMLEVLAVTEESKGKLAEYIQQREKAAKAYKEFREAVVNGVEVEKVEKVVETKRKFKAGDKVRVLDTENPIVPLGLGVGDVTEVLKYSLGGVVVVKTPRQAGYAFRESSLELVERKSPNELRAEVIQRAKDVLSVWKWKNGYYRNLKLPTPYNHWPMIAEFVINPEKRTVVALLKCHETLRLATSRIAKCRPGDVFNEHIGKAIALGRALGKDVSEFEDAVQPNEVLGPVVNGNEVLGPVVNGNEVLGPYRQDCKFTLTSKKDCDSFHYPECSEYNPDNHDDFIYNWQIGDIIDDTNAIYKEEQE